MPTHQKKLLPNHLLKKVVLKGQLTKKATPQPGAQKRASSEVPTQKKLLHNKLLKKKLNIKGQLTKKAFSQPATKKRAKYKGPTHQKSYFPTSYSKS